MFDLRRQKNDIPIGLPSCFNGIREGTMSFGVHLISMPHAMQNVPSIQIEALAAHLRAMSLSELEIETYSAFLDIPFRYGLEDFEFDFSEARDEINGYIYLKFFMQEDERVQKALPAFKKEILTKYPKVTNEKIERLQWATIQFIEKRLVPSLKKNSNNLVGFTLNYNQSYPSLFCMSYLNVMHPELDLTYVLGGSSVTLPYLNRLFERIGLDAFLIIGEGEEKMAELTSRWVALGKEGRTIEKLEAVETGILHSSRKFQVVERNPAWFKSNIIDLSQLKKPRFDEYFTTLRQYCRSEEQYQEYVREYVEVPIEGSRGCVFSCHFCNLNYQWEGYRKGNTERLYNLVNEATADYGVQRVRFLDNLTDVWLPQFLSHSKTIPENVDFFAEARSVHSQEFWTKCHLAGFRNFEIGIEAYSPKLLKIVNKKNKLIDNLRAQKYLFELEAHFTGFIITHYPGSDLADVEKTREIYELTYNLGMVRPVPFGLFVGSPAFNSLSKEEKLNLEIAPRFGRAYPEELLDFSVDHSFKMGSIRPSDEVMKSWSALTDHYHYLHEQYQGDHRLRQVRVEEHLVELSDRRWGNNKSISYEGLSAALYRACHQGLQLPAIKRKFPRYAEEEIISLLTGFIADKTMVFADDYYLSLALRAKEELLALETLHEATHEESLKKVL